MEPPDSSAARMPFSGATRVAAMSSMSFLFSGFSASSRSLDRGMVELSLEFSTLIWARLRLFSTEFPSIKLPRTVAEAIE